MVRYADDSVACFQYKDEAEKILKKCKEKTSKIWIRSIRRKDKNIRISEDMHKEKEKDKERRRQKHLIS